MSDESQRDDHPVMLVTVVPAREVLPDDKIPALGSDEAMTVSSDPDGPFRMLIHGERFSRVMTEMLDRDLE